MARPTKSADQKLSQTARFRMTVAERESLRSNAALCGITEAEFCRRRILGLPVTPTLSRSDPALILALNKVGNNVNQLARSVHRGSAFQRYWQEVGGELRTVLHRALEGIDG